MRGYIHRSETSPELPDFDCLMIIFHINGTETIHIMLGMGFP